MYNIIRIPSSSYSPKMLQGAQKPQIMYPANKGTGKGKTLYLIAKDKTKFNSAKDEYCDKMA